MTLTKVTIETYISWQHFDILNSFQKTPNNAKILTAIARIDVGTFLFL